MNVHVAESPQRQDIERAAPINPVDMIFNDAAFERINRLAIIMASGKCTVPVHLQGQVGDCFAIALQSMRWRMDPYAVAQKTHLVNGKLGYEAQLIAAVVNSSGVARDRFSFEWYGPWGNVIGNVKDVPSKKNPGETYRKLASTVDDEKGCGVRVWATLNGESEPRTIDLLLVQAGTRNSTLWADDPKQQLAYLAQKRWARLYAPDVILGVYSSDELSDPMEKDMGTATIIERTASAAQPEIREYAEEDFRKNLPAWSAAIESGKRTAQQIIDTVSTKGILADWMRDEILAAGIKQEPISAFDAAYDAALEPQQ